MSVVKFKNLYDFFSYIEFCPLCKKRTLPTVVFTSICIPTLTNKYLELADIDNNINITINLFTNEIISDSASFGTNMLVVGRSCSKYHFHYNGSCKISEDKLSICDISLEKYHFIRIMPNSTHFAVNNSFTNSTTSIRITANYKTHEIFLPLVNFNLKSKKKIDQKLKNIELLG